MAYLQSPSPSSDQTVVQTTPSNKSRPYVAALAFKALVTIMKTIPEEKSPDSWSGFEDGNNPQLTDGLPGSPTDVFLHDFDFQDVFEYSDYCEQTAMAERVERSKPHRSRHPFRSLPGYIRGSREVRPRQVLTGSGRKAQRSFSRWDKVLHK